MSNKMKYFKFPDEETAKKTTGWWSREDGWVKPSIRLEIAVVGVLLNNDGKYDEEGNLSRAPTEKDGFHINMIRGEVPEILKEYQVFPEKPSYILA